MATEGIFSSVNSEKDKQEDRDRTKCQRAGVGEYITYVHIVTCIISDCLFCVCVLKNVVSIYLYVVCNFHLHC